MALPATHTMIAEHPGKMDVTVAASGRELEADVQKKMKLWGVIEAFRDGSVPRVHLLRRLWPVLKYSAVECQTTVKWTLLLNSP